MNDPIVLQKCYAIPQRFYDEESTERAKRHRLEQLCHALVPLLTTDQRIVLKLVDTSHLDREGYEPVYHYQTTITVTPLPPGSAMLSDGTLLYPHPGQAFMMPRLDCDRVTEVVYSTKPTREILEQRLDTLTYQWKLCRLAGSNWMIEAFFHGDDGFCRCPVKPTPEEAIQAAIDVIPAKEKAT